MSSILVLEDLALDTPISRYMSFAAFCSILDTRKLFFNAASQFEDKSEGAATVINTIVATKMAIALHLAVNYELPGATRRKGFDPELDAKIAEMQAELDKPKIFQTPFGEFSDRDGWKYEQVLFAQRHWLDVSCWHMGVDESLAMWRIYGRTAEAVCLTSTVGLLKDALRLNEGDQCAIGQVHYITHSTDFFRTESSLAPLLHKMHAYAFEQEIRAIAWSPGSDIKTKRGEYGRPVDIDVSTLLTGVLVSPEAKPWFKAQVERTLEAKNYPCKVNTSLLDWNPWSETNEMS